MKSDISKHIFRAYDIRGLYKKDISPEIFYKIGLAAGRYVKKTANKKQLVVGNDIRTSSYPLVHAFIAGVSATGIDVTYTGTTAFGQTLFKGWELKQDLIAFVTASHLPPEWNGIKFYYGDGVGLPEEELMKIRDFTLDGEFDVVDWKQVGTVKSVDPKESYKDFFQSKFKFDKKLRVALDCGGASMTLSAPEIFDAVGIDTVPVFCEPDPSFSKRPSDPKPKNLTVLVDTVKKNGCDFGVAFDGDGDRSVIVDNTGKILSADETGIILGKYGLNENKGTIIVNVECSKAVKEQLSPLGFNVKQIQVGHTFLTLHAKQEKSPLGIESSGHLILPEYFLFDDALVVPLKIAEILDNAGKTLEELLKEVPTYPTKKEEIECADQIKFDVVNKLKNAFKTEFENTNTLDGIRINLGNGWVLIRPSNTSPIIRLTVEADDETVLN
ncbi:MAG: phosphomannomutase/phosphoglucomutase, partial [Candidatus Thermoplasmatota archaeon]|nr:phosphomannomutase/phosphoglucomutase [Candidatus Thermoplasmatota archaeon]